MSNIGDDNNNDNCMKHHAFISYSWVDNERLMPGELGWISAFVDRFSKSLFRELPRALRGNDIWLDYEKARGNESIKNTIRREVEASRILIPIISKSYLDSQWCMDELSIFVEKNGVDSGRIFPVWMDNNHDILPDALNDLFKYQFWYEDDNKKVRTRCFPSVDPTDREYGFIQQDMARNMASQLEKIIVQESVSSQGRSRRHTVKPVEHPRSLSDHVVLINGGEEDTSLIKEVALRLIQDHGVGNVIPINHMIDSETDKLKSSEITRDLREKLMSCTGVFLIYQDGPLIQLHRQVTEFLKIKSKRRKGAPEPRLDLCCSLTDASSLGINLPNMQTHVCNSNCAEECAKFLAAALS